MIAKYEEKVQKLMESILNIQRVFSSVKHNFLEKNGVSRSQMIILYFLDAHTKVSMKEIAIYLNTTNGAATQLVDGLVKYGYLERVSEPEDRRVVKLQFTGAGYKKFLQFREQHLEFVKSVFSELTEKEMDTLIKLQEKILNKFQK